MISPAEEMERREDALQLDKQLCFPLYACAREAIKRYKPFLDALELTYTQFIAMTVLWERRALSAKELGEALYLDSGTLTPLLKKLEARGLVTRCRSREDERSLIVTLTEKGAALRKAALEGPARPPCCPALEPEEARELHRLLNKLLKSQ